MMVWCVTGSATFVAFVFLSLCSDVLAQTNGRLEGRLTRRDGSFVAGAMVAVAGGHISTLTDADGLFLLEPVPTGPFAVTFSLGDRRETVDDVRLIQYRARLDHVVDWPLTHVESLTVEAASRVTERLLEAPASVDVVSVEAIARGSGHGQVPKLLAPVPGVEVVQSGIFDFNVNVRGLNSSLNRRVLTLVDGRDPASVLIGAQEWAAVSLPVYEIARIEVVRGPAAALYGANAFNGVVDITTRRPRDAPGGQVELTFGELGTVRGSVRQAGTFGTSTFYRMHATLGRSDDFYRARTTVTEYPGLPLEVRAPEDDRTQFVSAGGRVDRGIDGKVVTIEGGWAHTEGNVLLTGAGRLQNSGAHRPWLRSRLQAPSWQVSGYADARDGRMLSLTAGTMVFDDSIKASLDGSRRFDYGAGSGHVMVGGTYRYQRADTRDKNGLPTLLRDVEHVHEGSAFAQLDHPLAADRLKMVLATRVDTSTLHRAELSPKAALVYTPRIDHSVRVSFGHAFQTGSLVNYFTHTAAAPPISMAAIENALRPILGGVSLGLTQVPVLAVGNEDLKVERVDSFEVGYSGVINGRVVAGVNYYRNYIDNLITPLIPQVGTEFGRVNPAFQAYVPPAALSPVQATTVLGALRGALPPTVFALMSNDRDGAPIAVAASYTNLPSSVLQGIELSARLTWAHGFSSEAGFTALELTPKQELRDPLVTANAPPRKAVASLMYDRAKLSAALRYAWSDAFIWNGGVFRGSVPAASLVDVEARYRITPRVALQVSVANLFDHEHYEIFGGDLLRRRALAGIVHRW